jgi:uncharacterized membrane protein YhhN
MMEQGMHPGLIMKPFVVFPHFLLLLPLLLFVTTLICFLLSRLFFPSI